MSNTHTQIWQIAGGESGRFYTDLFLDHDLMCLGPGNPGKYEETVYSREVSHNGLSAHKRGQIKRFFQDVEPGNYVILRKGLKIVAVGKVPANESYQWSELFDDVYGWDLQHFMRVKWIKLGGEHPEIRELFHTRKQIPAFTAVDDQKITVPLLKYINKLDFDNEPLKTMPKPLPEPLKENSIEEQLFNEGLHYESVGKVMSAIRKLRRMASWYQSHGIESGRPTEHEVVAHMILPLLLALGWSEQLLAIEWNKIDLAAFKKTPTKPEDCVLVCEAKGLWFGLQNALEQAKVYVTKHNLSNCNKLILTDGLRIYVHERDSDNIVWEDEPAGYINVMKIRTNHLIPKDTSAIRTLTSLSPSGIRDSIKE